jgi:hypothetical protein
MPDGRLERTRRAYDQQPSVDEIIQFLEAVWPKDQRPEYILTLDEQGVTHRTPIQAKFVPRG